LTQALQRASVSPAHKQAATDGTDPSFADLGVPTVLVSALARLDITHPFPIQQATLPDSLAGRDVLGRGRTGSGKTIAFALPMIATLTRSGTRRVAGTPRALVLVPTRELAQQVAQATIPLAQSLGQRTMTIYGGVGQSPQVAQLRKGVDIVIATPGRLEDLIQQRHVSLADVEVTVLDEADHMADLGFLPAVKRILDQTPGRAQRLLFSATLDNAVDQLVRRYLHDPVTHSVDSVDSQVPEMTHHMFVVKREDKPTVLRELVSGKGRTLAFTRTKHAAKKLAQQLTAAGVPAVDLHGNLSQAARQRNLAAFGAGTVTVLVATDIAARGIHVDDIELVVHADPPGEHKAYLHRSGRTARAGAEGAVVTISTPDERRDVRTLMKRAGISPRHADVGPGHPAIGALTGPPADHVAPDLGRRLTQSANPDRETTYGRSGATGSGRRGRPRTPSLTSGGNDANRSGARPAGGGRRPAARRGASAASGSGARSAASFSAGQRRSR
jgi:superfamily II DNA/RNA helicase